MRCNVENSFTTLIKSNHVKSRDRWYPVSVDKFRNGFSELFDNTECRHPLVDNLAYNLQYLQFLEKEFSELELSSVINSMLVKTYVITGVSIIEAIFFLIIQKNGWQKKVDEEIVLNSKAQQKDKNGNELIIRTTISKKVEPHLDIMTFDSMTKCLKRHHKALSVDHLLYPQIDRARSLRNRVHLQIGDSQNDHDYNAFDIKVKEEMSNILYSILCSSKVTDYKAIDNYSFLKPNDS